MLYLNLTNLAVKQIIRHPVRSILTIIGVSTGMFLFLCVETMQSSLHASTSSQAQDDNLVVFRKDRFCPFTSNLPEHYANQIKAVPGVADVIPMKVLVSNCGASLDVITFRAIPDSGLNFFSDSFEYIAGDESAWQSRRDAAIIGKAVAEKRKLKVGDTFESAGVTAYVAAIIESDDPQHLNVALLHLDFLQQASKSGLGSVTQFNVKLGNSASPQRVSETIDGLFKNDQEPTQTRPENAFFATAARSIVNLVGFTHWVGIAAVCAVLALVTNTVMMAVRGRIRENSILQTVGYGSKELIWLVLVEGAILGIIGGTFAAAMASAILHWGNFTLSTEGLSLVFSLESQVIVNGLIISLLIGLFAGIFPAWQVSRMKIVDSLRMEG